MSQPTHRSGEREKRDDRDEQRAPDVLRIASYNVRDFLDDRHAAARVVRAIGPDVLCLQEVPRRLTTEVRLPTFARACGLLWGGRRRGSGGTIVLHHRRVQVHEDTTRRLSVRFPDRTRGFHLVSVSLPGTARVTVVSVHLSLRSRERVRHAQALLDAAGAGSVIAGDLNEDASGQAWQTLAVGRRLASPDAPTFPSQGPHALLDVVLVPETLAVVDNGQAPTWCAPDLPRASDHLPVWVDVRLPPAPAS